MMFQIQIAGKIIEIEANHQWVFHCCKDYLISGSRRSNPDISIRITQNEIENEIESIQASGIKAASILQPISPGYIESIMVYRKIADALIPFDILMMHGSVVSTEGVGYMLAAPSGIGKTTRTRLWLDNIEDSIVVNGDKPLIEIGKEKIIAYGTPWAGKEKWNSNVSVPLRAILFIERATCPDQYILKELEMHEAFPFLLQQTYQPDDPLGFKRTLQMLKKMNSKVRFYRFQSEPTNGAILSAYQTLKHR